MTEISSAFLSVCLLAISTGLLKMLLPDSKYKRQISFLIACVFSVMVFGIADKGIGVLAIDFSAAETVDVIDYSDKLSDNVREQSAKAVREKIESLLDSNDIQYKKIYVIVHIDSALCISISEIELVFSKGASPDMIESALKLVTREVGSKIEVYYTVE